MVTLPQDQATSSTRDSNVLPVNSNLDRGERWRIFWVFLRWCLQRESQRLWNYTILMMPVFVSGYLFRNLVLRPYPVQGPAVLEILLAIGALFLFIGGVRHASSAVCWEVSNELRDLVRLTGIDPAALLWCKSLCRWWTIGLSILLILPLTIYARTIGAISGNQWFAGGCWLLLVTVLTAGFAMVASVSSNRAANAETTAASGSLLLMVVYHIIFWITSALIGVVLPYLNGQMNLSIGSMEYQAARLAMDCAPFGGVYRGLRSPATFSPLDPTFWVHFITAILCMWAATVVMKNRLRVTTQGDAPIIEPGIVQRRVINRTFSRPRCTDRPFFWKDTYILGAGRWSQAWWTFLSVMGLIFLIGSTIRNVNSVEVMPLVFGIIAVCLLPCVIAVRLDALLTAEIRDNTWTSLMLLPIDPRVPIIAKIQAAAWERKAIFVPVIVGAAIASSWNVTAVFVAATIALLVGILMIEISILNQFYSKSWWVGPVTGVFIVCMVVAIIPFWVVGGVAMGFLLTCLALATIIFCVYAHIVWRLNHWTET